MVMEFSDVVMNVGSHEMNTSHWKQFCEASGLRTQWAVAYVCAVREVVAGV